jgi:BirA family biotin operon repressor/biotin-[acetyl-CoA-carboxylase] ligase
MPHQILKFLRENAGPLSGETISAGLGMTGAAVRKKIGILREHGFVIAGTPSRGYRLLASPDLSAEEVLSYLDSDFWKKILFYQSVDSTNEVASTPESHCGSAGGGTVIIADAQESGRGRLGRRWISPPGMNIYMSMVLRPDIRPRDVPLLTLLAAVASARGLRQSTGVEVSIKWPNDLVISGKKAGGILTEVRSGAGRTIQAVIGVGLNVNMKCRDLPDGLKEAATSLLDETGRRYSRTAIVAGILKEFEHWYQLFLKRGRAPLLLEWKRLSATLGKSVRVATAGEMIQGVAEDLDDEGMLILRLSSGETRLISAGDLTMLR